jgi:hypothetical protein
MSEAKCETGWGDFSGFVSMRDFHPTPIPPGEGEVERNFRVVASDRVELVRASG